MSLFRTTIRVIAVLAVSATTTAALAGGLPAQAGPGRDISSGDPALQTIDLHSSLARTQTVTETRPFSLLGATWTNPRTALAGTVQVRTRAAAGGRWSGWQTLEADEPDAASAGEPGAGRGSTDPLWVGESNGVQARVAATGGVTHPLPAGLRLDLINPDAPTGRSAAVTVPGNSAAVAVPGNSAVVAVPGNGVPRPIPLMISRAGWGANEAIVKHAPEYTTDVQVLFVHHTATGNAYSCSQSAGIVRGIEQYHVGSKGWNDIGYNFLVDKCGTLFEGRKGGVNMPVLGAHTLGFNSHSSAIAVIGDYSAGGVSTTVRNVIAQVAAYKIGAYGHLPSGRVVLTSNGSDRYPLSTRVTLNRISGHLDTGRTECPGNALYAQLGSIRAIASTPPKGLDFQRISGADRVGALYYTRGAITPTWTLRTPSSSIDHFDVQVDHATKAVTGRSRTYPLHLSPGRHTVTIRAVLLNGLSAIVTTQVIAGSAGPVFTVAPAVTLRAGSLASTVPIRLAYAVTAIGGLRTVTLTNPFVLNLGVVPRSWTGFVRPEVATTWSVRAVDWAGNATSASISRTPVVVPVAEAERTGRWRTLADPVYLGGQAAASSTAGSRLSWTFIGSTGQLAVTRTPTSGRLHVYLDERDAGFVDLRSAAVDYRYAVFAPSWPDDGPHTLAVSVEGTAGRPGVIVDGLIRLEGEVRAG